MTFGKRFHKLSFLVLVLYCTGTSAQESSSLQLFEYAPTEKLAGTQTVQQSRAMRSIRINRKAQAIHVGSRAEFKLPDGSVLDISITRKRIAENGDIQITGEFSEDGIAIFTYGKDSTFANLTSADHNYAIGIDANKQAFLIDYKEADLDLDLGDDMRFPPGFEPMSPDDIRHTQTPQAQKLLLPSGKYEVTLLAIYSPQFANGFANPVTRINQMIAFSNSAYERSGINIEMKLAHAQQINFTNDANIGTLLSQVSNGTGAFSGVEAIRNQYYADLVAVLPFKPSGSIAGIAWVNGNNSNFAYSVSQFSPRGSDSLFAHEIGHNLGSGHERLSANPRQPDPCGGGITGYACGHGNGSRGTIMSYLDDRAWGYVFSNPQLTCDNGNGNNEPCGIANGQANAADNKTSFNITAPLVSNFLVDNSNDDDKDGVKNDVDNCPNVKNPDQANNDQDTQGDVCDSDDDNDGVNDPIDNCPLDENPEQEDTNNNGIGNACESDEMCFPLKISTSKMSVLCL